MIGAQIDGRSHLDGGSRRQEIQRTTTMHNHDPCYVSLLNSSPGPNSTATVLGNRVRHVCSPDAPPAWELWLWDVGCVGVVKQVKLASLEEGGV